MKLALTIAGKEFGLTIGQRLSPDMASWIRGDDGSDSSEGAKLIHPYSQSTWVYVAITTLAVNVAQIPFRICRMSQSAAAEGAKIKARRGARSFANFRKKVLLDNVVESGPVVDLFRQPHPTLDRSLYWQNLMTWRCLRGEFFIVPLDAADQPVDLATPRPRIQRLLTLNPDMLWHMVTGFELHGWRYTGSPLMSPLPSQILLPSEVIHSRSPNPMGF